MKQQPSNLEAENGALLKFLDTIYGDRGLNVDKMIMDFYIKQGLSIHEGIMLAYLSTMNYTMRRHYHFNVQ